MDVIILDQRFEQIAVVDVYESFIWTDRYNEAGDFELYMPVETPAFPYIELGNYVQILDSDRYMIIETIEITTDVEAGNHLIVSGSSLEKILDRRVVWEETELVTNVEAAVKKLITDSIISPKNAKRKIPNFTYKASGDSYISTTAVNTSYFAESVYEAVQGLCGYADCGFRVLPKKVGNEAGFEFQLYRGVNRSYSQEQVPWVAFSPNLDNLLSSNFLSSDVNYKTACLAVWDNEETITQEAYRSTSGPGEGLNRREMTSSVVDLGVEIDYGENGLTDAQREKYKKIIFDKGRDALYDHSITSAFEGDLDTTRQYIYGRDFFIGDIVQVTNEYGLTGSARVSEVTRSFDEEGARTITTFEVV